MAWIATIVLLTLAYYFWTTVCSFDTVPEIPPRGARETDHYNMLSRGFLSGHLYLDGDVPKALLEAANPYDPKSRGNVEVLHDASFYRGKYYIYFGPAPVVTLFLPFTVITGRDLPIPYAVLIFAAGCFLALTATFLSLQRRYFPTASIWTIVAGILAVGSGSLIVALLRRPHIWEVATASGLFYFSVSIYCLVRALASTRATTWSALGGVALGLAVASRPTYIVCSVVFALPLLLRQRPAPSSANYTWKALLGAAIGCACVVLPLLAYNYARFGNPAEFGQKYQLSSIIEGDARHFSLTYLGFNLRVYFLSALRWTDAFPFHHGIAVPRLPAGHGGYEYSVGVLANLPFSWFAFCGLAAMGTWIWRRERGDHALAVALFAAVVGLQAGLLLCYFGSCIRYMAEFTPWIMMVAAFGALIAESTLGSTKVRTAFGVSAAALAVFSAIASGLAVVNLYNEQTGGMTPIAYRPVARVMNYPFFALRQLRYPDYRPLELTLTFPSTATPRQEPLVTVRHEGRARAAVFIDYLGGDTLRLGYREGNGSTTAFSPTIAPTAGVSHRLQVSLGTNYADYDGHRFRLRVHLDGWPLWDVPVISDDAFPGRLELGRDGDTRFTGTIHSSRSIHESDFSPPRAGGARLRIALRPDMAGRSFPLMSSGRTEAGDLLFMRVGESGAITLGYDHWADVLRLAPEIPTRFGENHVVEFWMPAVTSPGAAKRGESELLVKLDGVTAWQRSAPFFPTTPRTLFVGLNPIGGSTCETVLPHSVIEETQIAPPVQP